MRVVFLGVVFLLAALFPVGEFFARWLLAPFHNSLKGTTPVLLHLLLLAVGFVPAALIAGWFFRASKLAERVPTPTPGRSLVLLGVILMAIYLLARLLASTVEGGGGSYVVMNLAPFIVWPSRILLAVGFCKVLLSANPSDTTFQPTRPM